MAERDDAWPREYKDFFLHLHPAGPGRFGISASSPVGEAEGEMTAVLPQCWSRASRDCVLRDLAEGPRPSHGGLSPKAVGTELYRALFPGDIRSLFERSCDQTRAEGAGLRVKIFLSPRNPGLRTLQGFPWELMYQEDRGRFLGLSRWTPIVRSLPVSEPPAAPGFPDRVRVLAALASPRGTQALDLHRELSGMRAADGQTRFDVVRWTATLRELRTTLDREGPIHVFHFLGHGEVRSSGNGVLVFESPGGAREDIPGGRLAETLRDYSGLQLLVLNACDTARVKQAGDPFGSVAAALVQAGFPAVLAMQEPVADSDAVTLSQTLYQHLALGRPLEGALAEARQAVCGPRLESFAWALPSLFLRASPVPPRKDGAESAIQDGIALFRSGQHALARQRLREGLKLDPGHARGRLFENLSRMAAGDLSTAAVAEIDDGLQKLFGADAGTARLARLALGLLRIDAVEPRGIRVRGMASSRLFQELETLRWSPEETEIARALAPSRRAGDLLRLRT